MSTRLRGFGPVGVLGLLIVLAGNFVIAPLSAVLVLVWARLSQTSWPALGFAPPRSWTRVFAIGIPLGIFLKLVMKAIVMPLLGAPALNSHYHYLAGNAAAALGMVVTVVVVGGVGEEIVYRGFLFERLGKLLGTGRAALVATILLTSGWFAMLHYPEQGWPGVEQAALTGAVFGSTFAATGQLWLPMVLHAAFDVTAVALIYWNWESAVAGIHTAFGWAWLAATIALAVHVADEATHDFLAWYNPRALRIRQVLCGLLFPPTFTFWPWLIGLMSAVLLLAAMTPSAFAGEHWLRSIAYFLSIVHVANGLLHLGASVLARRAVPGVLSAPLLLLAGVWLAYAAAHLP